MKTKILLLFAAVAAVVVFAYSAKTFVKASNNSYVPVSDSVDLAISGSANVDSILTGANFIYTLNFSVSSLTANGQNVKIKVTLPQNLSVNGGTSGIAYDHSQVSSVSIVGSLVTVNLINPIPAGSTGQLQMSLVYPNGTTPGGYMPPISAQISANNAYTSPVISDTTYVKALAANNIQLTKTANTTNAQADHYFTYTIAYSNLGGSTGNLNLSSAKIVDTLRPCSICKCNIIWQYSILL